MRHAVNVNNLSKKFGKDFAVEDLNFQIDEGEIVAFLGPNGAGKTTTIRLLNGVLQPTSGNAEVLGYDLSKNSNQVKSRSGVTTESLSLYERLSGRYNLEFHSELYNIDKDMAKSRIEQMIHFFDLEDYIDGPVETYSTGMKKKLSLAKALLHDPEILFLDEPTTGLDPESSKMVLEYIERLNKEEQKTTFLCTHNLQVAESLATRIMLIDKGELIKVAKPEELRNELWPETEVKIICKNWNKKIKNELKDRKWIQNISIVKKGKSITRNDLNEIVIDITDEDYTPDLAKYLVDMDCRIYSIEQTQHSLEDIYFRIRGENGE